MLEDKPAGASWPVWKIILVGLFGNILFVFLVWLFNSTLHQFNTGIFLHPLTIGEILLGSIWLPLNLWMYWAWKPKRKHARWHRWLHGTCIVLYISVLMLLLSASYWNALLRVPWNWVVNGTLVMLFITAWILPAISYSAAKKLAGKLFRMLSWGPLVGLMGSAGIIGANFGMHASRNGEVGSALFVIALMCSPLALSVAQMGAEAAWKRRPWAKEEGE